MATLLPTSPQSLFFSYQPSSRWAHTPYPTLITGPFPRPFLCSSSFSSSSPQPTVAVVEEVVEDSPSPPLDGASAEDESAIGTVENLQLRGCKACGREEIEKGCNGEGRIQGGIATVPGFGWWPIKAYRPCPGFVESGGRYRRRGQSMDEVAFGREEREDTTGGMDEVQSSKKKQSSRKFKR
ncbi:uncharacterized protein LOC131245197 [Magnolia sinica]|uniref:uncharacterized protein LOC131245197 n=1 Tax=Magnolia sinica TaxID=86752 RepID=UPI002657E86A|nr:uncharacterized protein LOC131245197 [Magnolia sinica]